MTSVYHIVTIRVNETSWAHVWRLRFRYLETGYDMHILSAMWRLHLGNCSDFVGVCFYTLHLYQTSEDLPSCNPEHTLLWV
jgi:hypothetical protein